MAPLMPHTTIANYQKRPRYLYEPDVINYRAAVPYAQAVPIDEGFIDYKAFLGALRGRRILRLGRLRDVLAHPRRRLG